MKKIFALTIAVMTILTCFTACKPKIKNGVLLQNQAGENIAAVTQANGGIARDDAGNVILLVTDANGKNVKDANGEYATKAVALEHALVVGNVIECTDFAMTIPNGWSNEKSFTELMIRKDGTADLITVGNDRSASVSETLQKVTALINNIQALNPSAVIRNTSVDILGNKANYLSGYVADDGTGKAAFLGYIIFSHEGSVFICNLISDHDMNENLDEYLKIINTVEFR